MTAREAALYSAELRRTAASINTKVGRYLGPHEGEAAHRELIKLANAVANRAGRALVREVLNEAGA